MATTAARNEPFTLALGLSVLLHAVALTLAAAPIVRETLAAWQASMASARRVVAPASPQEIEVMMPAVMVVPPTPPPQQFIRTDGLAEATPSSPNSRFISDRDTRAASEVPADVNGPPDLPSQQGIDLPVVEIIRTPLSEGEREDQPPQPEMVAATAPPAPTPPTTSPEVAASPAVAPSPPPPPVDLESIATTPRSDREVRTDKARSESDPTDPSEPTPPSPTTAMVAELREPPPEPRDTPPAPPATAPPAPPRTPPPAGFSGLREPTRQHGTITNRGPASIDAADTPIGRYMKEVTGAIEREWHRKRRTNADFVTFGTIKLEFSVNRLGQVQSLAIKNRNGANAVMQDFTLNAVLDAKIPPMPPGLPEIFDHDRLQISYDIIVY